jgi:hypothetical protein
MRTKILLAFAILFCAAITTNAQITEGRYLLGGSAGYGSSKTNVTNPVTKNESLSTNIQFGKVIKENTTAGIILSYASSNMGNLKINQYGGGVFYRKYKPLAKNFYFFGELDGVYNYSKYRQGIFQIGNNGTRSTGGAAIISFVPGISYTVWKKMQMELSMPNLISVSYSYLKDESTFIGTTSVLSSKSNNFSANANFNANLLSSFGIGFKFLLGK